MAFEVGKGSFFIRGQKGSLTAGKYSNKRKTRYKGVRIATVDTTEVGLKRDTRRAAQGGKLKKFAKAAIQKTAKAAKGRTKAVFRKFGKSFSPIKKAIGKAKAFIKKAVGR